MEQTDGARNRKRSKENNPLRGTTVIYRGEKHDADIAKVIGQLDRD